MNIDPTWPEWVVRQGFACAWVQAPSAKAAVELAARRLGHMGGWKVGPGIDQEVYPQPSTANTLARGTTRGP